jgi:N-glycosylase/DNA lyase
MFRDRMFYRIIAVKFFRDGLPAAELDALLWSALREGMKQEEVEKALQAILRH